MTSPHTHPKRFYKTAASEPLGDGWTIALDGRTIKTPARAGLVLPTQALADALAAEWNAQADHIDLAALYLTRLANVAIDRASETREELADEVARFCETDLICHIAWDRPPLTRRERANKVRKRNYFTRYGDQARAGLVALLDKYADEGIATLESAKVLRLDPFTAIGTPVEIINNIFGGKDQFDAAIAELEQELYRDEKSA